MAAWRHHTPRGRAAHHAGHQRAAQRVAQADVVADMQARQHMLEGFTKEGLEVAAACGVKPSQQARGARVGGLQLARFIKGQQPRRQGVQILGAGVDGQHQLLAHLMHEHAVFDVRHGHLHQGLGMALARFEVRRGIEHTDDRARSVAHRCGRARDLAQAVEVMLHAGDGDRLPGCQRRAQAVGATKRLAPAAAGDDASVAAAHRESVVSVEVEDDAVVVGEGQQEVRAGDLLRQRFKLGACQAAHELAAFAPAHQVVVRHDLHRQRRSGVQPTVHAAHPAVQHQRGWQPVGWQRIAARTHRAGVGQRHLLKCLHGVVSWRTLHMGWAQPSAGAQTISATRTAQLHSFCTSHAAHVPELHSQRSCHHAPTPRA